MRTQEDLELRTRNVSPVAVGSLTIEAAEADVSGRSGVGAVIGEHRVHRVGHGFDRMAEEVAQHQPYRLLLQLEEG